MRKPLMALSFALSAGLGAIPVAGALAANPSATHTKSNHATTYSTNSTTGRPANAVSGAQIVQFALKYLGYPYTATGDSPSTGFSCIGFVSYVYRSLGIPLPGSLDTALAYAPRVPFSQLEPGDILYFQNTVWNGLSHAAIYIGGGRFVHAEYYGYGVRISSFNNDSRDGNYWITKYLTANRPWGGAVVTPIISSPGTGSVGSGTPGSTSVAGDSGGPQAIVTVPSLNVRSGPSMKRKVQTVVAQGTTVTILSKGNGWYKVQLADGTTGWVIAAGIGLGTPSTSVQQQVSTASTPSGSAPTRQGYPVVTKSTYRSTTSVQVSSLRVHSSPAVSAPVETAVLRGQHLRVLARSHGWLEVQTPSGQIGWVMGAYTSHGSRSTSPSAVAAKTAAPVRRYSTASSRVGGLRVHSAPSVSASVVTALGQGQSMQVISRSAGWLEIRTGSGQVGWVEAGYTSAGGATTFRSSSGRQSSMSHARSAGGSVMTAGVRVHAAPGIHARVIGGVAAGTHVQVLGRNGPWVLVRLPNGQSGYVYGAYVR